MVLWGGVGLDGVGWGGVGWGQICVDVDVVRCHFCSSVQTPTSAAQPNLMVERLALAQRLAPLGPLERLLLIGSQLAIPLARLPWQVHVLLLHLPLSVALLLTLDTA